MKMVKTSVMDSELAGHYRDDSAQLLDFRLWVACPDHYDADKITAGDIHNDSMIRVVDGPTDG